MLRRIALLSLLLSLLMNAFAMAATITTFEDIPYWIGTGENRAALVVDWDSSTNADESLVWGYRWSGSATGEDMLRAAIVADDRFYAKFGTAGSFGVPIYGLGYDLNHDGAFGITDGSSFDEQGITESGVPDPPPQTIVAASVDAADLYAEGFFTGSFNYASGQGNPFAGGNWNRSLVGASSRTLADGDWDSWAFESPVDLMSMAFAENPIAAEPSFSADFDADGDVDGIDFLNWQRGFGIQQDALPSQGDANADGRVDHVDLQLWSLNFGTPIPPGAIVGVPEPTPLAFLITALFVFFTSRISPRRSI